MRTRGEIVAAARRCIGAPFRPHGRDTAWGLDCVGVAGQAYARPSPRRYPLRGGCAEGIGDLIRASGLRAIEPERAQAGDLLLIEAGMAQFHLAIITDAGFVHADAGLRRVVETPVRPAGTVRGAWTEQD
jgi:murein DD-endopeptidase / murein LD-carboxypeptidase